MSLGLYFHTLRHLRPIQFYGRVAHHLHRPRPDTRPAPAVRPGPVSFPLAPRRSASMRGPSRFEFLNVTRELASAADWNDRDADRLWLYNLHYFDDLNASGREHRVVWHQALIRRWIAENAPGQGSGWDPYPLSRRIVNWVRWALAGHALPAESEQSLAVQTRFLTQRLEYHLLGNHLWANGKALVFAGAFFAGEEASGWLDKGLGIVGEQLAEQVLPDGGHFERSPMYHSIFIEDLLDLVALSWCRPGLIGEATVAKWKQSTSAMLSWLEVMTHPDGEIAFFNDAALGIAPRLDVLRTLARTLAIESNGTPATGVVMLEPSGYARMTAGEQVVIADVGPIGPDYIPGHAHADTLSFELSWGARRLLSNSGTSCYGTGPQRQLERGTAAHNTVTVDEKDSSEVWHGFRVARRASIFDLEAMAAGGRCLVRCAHDGYMRLRGRPVHRREWQLDRQELRIRDEISGAGSHRVTGYLHLQPGVEFRRMNGRAFELSIAEVGRLRLQFEDVLSTDVTEGFLAREFGKLTPRPVIAWHRAGRLPFAASMVIGPAT